MKILFLTLIKIDNINDRNIYSDLMRKFIDEGHQVYIVSPVERRYRQKSVMIKQGNLSILKVKTLNIQKTNLLEKGIGTLLIEHKFHRAISKYFKHIKFDLLLYSTPPITLTSIIKTIKDKTGALTYLLLKDIFPQNAVDIGLLNPESFLYRYFRRKEKKLYDLSDYIGCMSPANVGYLLKHNPEISADKVEVNPNSIELIESGITFKEKKEIRKRYNIPEQSIAFIYGGNLGKPQGLNFLLEVIKENKEKKNVFFLIIGTGTEFNKLNIWFIKHKPSNALLLPGLPKEKYDKLVQACDVGLIFLNRNFTIPNFPSRLLSYLEYKLPIVAATDPNTDIGKIAQEKGFGFYVENGDIKSMNQIIELFHKKNNLLNAMGNRGYNYLKENFLVSHSYMLIHKKLMNRQIT